MTTTNVVINATTNERRGRAPLGPAVGGATAVGSARQSLPSQRQLDYLAMLALQRGLCVPDILSDARTKAEASSLIDILRAPSFQA